MPAKFLCITRGLSQLKCCKRFSEASVKIFSRKSRDVLQQIMKKERNKGLGVACPIT